MKEGRLGQSPPAEVRVETTMVQMGLQMKYLGLTFNGLWALTSSDWLPDWADWLMPWLASCPIFGPGAAARQGYMRPSGVPLWSAGLGQRDGARRPDSSMYKSDAALPRPSNIKGIQDDVACRRDESSRMFLPRISWDNNYR